MNKKLNHWLSSKNENLIWFASEIISCFKMPELENAFCLLLPENNLGKLKEYPLNYI